MFDHLIEQVTNSGWKKCMKEHVADQKYLKKALVFVKIQEHNQS